jgi:hypothetical protein
MNAVRMKQRRRAIDRHVNAAFSLAMLRTVNEHTFILRKAIDRIDHHDEKLGITRPIGSWNP